jgi:membrane-bound lytic murein transglycosylase B
LWPRRTLAALAALLALVAVLGLAGCAARQPVAPPPCPPTSPPRTLACLLTEAQKVIDNPAVAPGELAAAGRRAQDAYQRLGDHPEWDAEVLAGLTPATREQAGHAVDAYRQLTSLNGPPSATLPAWRVVDPLPADQLREMYQAGQRRFGVDWTVLASVNLVETRMGRVVGLSTAGARGPMQFMPATWASYGLGGDVWNPSQAIMGAANYLAANGGARPAGLDHALRRYNNDVRYVRAVRDYAAMMAANPRAYLGMHAWRVEYRTVAGLVVLPTGYAEPKPVPVGPWLAAHPPPAGER